MKRHWFYWDSPVMPAVSISIGGQHSASAYGAVKLFVQEDRWTALTCRSKWDEVHVCNCHQKKSSNSQKKEACKPSDPPAAASQSGSNPCISGREHANTAVCASCCSRPMHLFSSKLFIIYLGLNCLLKTSHDLYIVFHCSFSTETI